MWALQRLRKLLTTEFGQSINIHRLLGDNDGDTRALVWNMPLNFQVTNKSWDMPHKDEAALITATYTECRRGCDFRNSHVSIL